MVVDQIVMEPPTEQPFQLIDTGIFRNARRSAVKFQRGDLGTEEFAQFVAIHTEIEVVVSAIPDRDLGQACEGDQVGPFRVRPCEVESARTEFLRLLNKSSKLRHQGGVARFEVIAFDLENHLARTGREQWIIQRGLQIVNELRHVTRFLCIFGNGVSRAVFKDIFQAVDGT